MNDLITQSNYPLNDLERIAIALAKSQLFGLKTPEQALALCLISQAEGRHPASAANDYDILFNRPAKKARAMQRDFLAAGGKIEWHALTDTLADATFSHPQGGSVRISWDMARVKQAQIKNDMYGKFPRAMLKARTVSEGVSTIYPAATSGMYVPEEIEDMQPIRDVTPRPAPARLAEPKPAEKTPFDSEPETMAQDEDQSQAGNFDATEWARGWRAHFAACTTEHEAALMKSIWLAPENREDLQRVVEIDKDLAAAVKRECAATVKRLEAAAA